MRWIASRLIGAAVLLLSVLLPWIAACVALQLWRMGHEALAMFVASMAAVLAVDSGVRLWDFDRTKR